MYYKLDSSLSSGSVMLYLGQGSRGSKLKDLFEQAPTKQLCVWIRVHCLIYFTFISLIFFRYVSQFLGLHLRHHSGQLVKTCVF